MRMRENIDLQKCFISTNKNQYPEGQNPDSYKSYNIQV